MNIAKKMKHISPFRFKHFAVWHHRSAMKVGVDGVLIGCWTDITGARNIIDVGTGCGLIALIMAQRQPEAYVTAVDIDEPSYEEATENISASPWSNRVEAKCGGFPEVIKSIKDSQGKQRKYDLVVSNPPYFDSGMHDLNTPRERARHQGTLSPYSLLADSRLFLSANGSVAMVVPAEYSERIETYAKSLGYSLSGKCLVRGNPEVPFKRVLLQWRISKSGVSCDGCRISELTLEVEPGVPTEEYRLLCKDFYLKF